MTKKTLKNKIDFKSFWHKTVTFLKSNTFKHELKRYSKLIGSFFVVAWIVTTITFILLHIVPGSEIQGKINDTQREVMKIKYGLDKPLVVQYFIFLGHILTGNLGVTTTVEGPGTEISSFLGKRMAISFSIGIVALLIGVSVGIILGILIGIKPGGWADNIGTIVISLGIAMPSFVIGLLLLLLGKSIGLPYIYDRHNAASIILPAIALSIGTIIVYMRYLRVEMSGQLSSNHYKFAQVKGVKKRRFIFRHALKPALFPVISYLPSAVLASFIGSMFIEGVFAIPGSGGLMLDAIRSKDYNVVQVLVVIYSGMTIISFFLRDLMYRLLDPRVRW